MVGVLHLRREDHAARIESHGQALAGTLRMPNHADAAVAGLAPNHWPGIIAPGFLGKAAPRATARCKDRGPKRFF